MNLINELKKRAQSISATIIMPEAHLDQRVYDACQIILREKLCNIIVFGTPSDYDETFNCDRCQIIDIDNYRDLDKFAECLYELRKNKGMTLEQAPHS